MSAYGVISRHLWRARETALSVDTTSTWQRLAIDALVLEIDTLLIVARKLHHRVRIDPDDD